MDIFLDSSYVRGKTLELTVTKGGCTLAYDKAQGTDRNVSYCECACSQAVGLAMSRPESAQGRQCSLPLCGFTDTIQKVLGDYSGHELHFTRNEGQRTIH